METTAQESRKSQAELKELKDKDVEDYLEHVGPEEFWKEIGRMII